MGQPPGTHLDGSGHRYTPSFLVGNTGRLTGPSSPAVLGTRAVCEAAGAAGVRVGSLPAVVLVQLLSAGVVSLPLPALASDKLKLASRSGQKGSMAHLQRDEDLNRMFLGNRPWTRLSLSTEEEEIREKLVIGFKETKGSAY